MNVGDKITCVWRNASGVFTVHARVMRGRADLPARKGCYFVEFFLRNGAQPISLRRLDGCEGIAWIAGHHAEDSDAARALLATAALS